MGVQLSLKAALPLAGILATASDHCSKTGPRQAHSQATTCSASDRNATKEKTKTNTMCESRQQLSVETSHLTVFCTRYTMVHIKLRHNQQKINDVTEEHIDNV